MHKNTTRASRLSTGEALSPLPAELQTYYSDIVSLSQKRGYCWAKIDYFIGIWDVKRWKAYAILRKLSEKGYIRCVDVPDSHERRLYPVSLSKKMPRGVRRPGKAGNVYMVRTGSLYKIGQTVNVLRRIEQLQTGCPFDISLIHSFPCSDMNAAESYWHERFGDQNERGEWFTLSDLNRIEFCRVKAMSGQEVVF